MYCNVYFTDQIRAFGSGYRTVQVAKGRKWVHLTTVHFNKDLVSKGKMPIKEWSILERKARIIDESEIKRGLRKAKKIVGGH